MVIAVKTTVYAVILAVIGNVKRGKQIHGIAEMAAGFLSRSLGHFFQERLGGGREQSLEIFQGTDRMGQGCPDILGCVVGVIIGSHLAHDFFAYIRLDLLHAGEIFHVAFPKRRVCFQTVFLCQRLFREILRSDAEAPLVRTLPSPER